MNFRCVLYIHPIDGWIYKSPDQLEEDREEETQATFIGSSRRIRRVLPLAPCRRRVPTKVPALYVSTWIHPEPLKEQHP